MSISFRRSQYVNSLRTHRNSDENCIGYNRRIPIRKVSMDLVVTVSLCHVHFSDVLGMKRVPVNLFRNYWTSTIRTITWVSLRRCWMAKEDPDLLKHDGYMVMTSKLKPNFSIGRGQKSQDWKQHRCSPFFFRLQRRGESCQKSWKYAPFAWSNSGLFLMIIKGASKMEKSDGIRRITLKRAKKMKSHLSQFFVSLNYKIC